MGLADRDYYRQPPRGNAFSNIGGWSVTTWLIAINVAVYVVDMISRQQVAEFGYFSIHTAVYGLQIWRWITCQFLHWDNQHIFMNMLALYFAGPPVESVLGARRFIAFYLLCGIAGPSIYILFGLIGLLHVNEFSPMMGASAGIFGLLIACAVMNPNMRVLFSFVIPLTMRQVAYILIAMAVVSVVFEGKNAGGEAAHIGGAALGFLLIKNPRLLNFATYRRGPKMRYRP